MSWEWISRQTIPQSKPGFYCQGSSKHFAHFSTPGSPPGCWTSGASQTPSARWGRRAGRGRATTGLATTTTQVFSLNYHVDIVDIFTDNRLPGLQPRDGVDGLLLQLLLPGLLRHGGAGPPAAGLLASIRRLDTNHIRWLVTFCIAHGYLSCQMHSALRLSITLFCSLLLEGNG